MIGGCMNKVYNTQKDIARGFEKFFQKNYAQYEENST